MSANKQPSATMPIDLSEDQVREYLKENGDFLQRNPDLLDHLHVSHASGSAVSLVEKQVSVLRERNMEMRHRLTGLTTNWYGTYIHAVERYFAPRAKEASWLS